MCAVKPTAVYSLSRCVRGILPGTHKLLESIRKHKASANCIKIKGIDKECVIASSDGACIIWDLVEARIRPLNPFCFLAAGARSHHSDGGINSLLMQVILLLNLEKLFILTAQ